MTTGIKIIIGLWLLSVLILVNVGYENLAICLIGGTVAAHLFYSEE